MKKMNKTFLAGTAFAISAASALALSGCCVPFHKPTPAVYGPPEYFEVPTEAITEPPVYGPPEVYEIPNETIENDFTVEDEILEDVYGPPAIFD